MHGLRHRRKPPVRAISTGLQAIPRRDHGGISMIEQFVYQDDGRCTVN
jgi:hypothetical protein